MKQALPVGGPTIAKPPGAKPPGANPTRLVLIFVVLVIVVLLLRSVFAHHETKFERIGFELTESLQNNDIAKVAALQNSETRGHVTRAAVGHAADIFKPLGKLDRVRETGTASGESHEFEATFDKGVVHETIQFDPDAKIVHFRFDPPTPK